MHISFLTTLYCNILSSFSGSSIIAVQESALVVDGKAIGKYHSFLTALTLLFGVYYVFNIEYPGAAAATLEFIQRYLKSYSFCLQPMFNQIIFI